MFASDVRSGKEMFIKHLLCARPRVGPIEGGGWIGPVPGFCPLPTPVTVCLGCGVA